VAPGIEDLQIELGIDLDAETAAGFGAVDGYVEPNAVPPGARILAVRVWLLVRAIDPENGFTDTRELRYSDRVWPARDDRHRRAVYSATIFVNNAPGV
jgi:type IV pilus assembly protein PilW